MKEIFGHHQLHNRYCFEGTLVLLTPLRISSGRADDNTDAPLMRTREGSPYIPGSSLRGAIRSEMERILTGIQKPGEHLSCVLFSDDDCNVKIRKLLKGSKKEDKKEISDGDLAKLAESDLCALCKLFGASIFASRLIIEDAYPMQNKEQLSSKLAVRDGIGIDRDTGTTVEGAKFNYEVMETGPEFEFTMQIENISGHSNKDRMLINLILGLLKQGIYIGGKRAAGLGKIQLKDYKVSGFENPEAIRQAILKQKKPSDLTSKWKEEAAKC
jgi:CRISPR-associated protein Csm3